MVVISGRRLRSDTRARAVLVPATVAQLKLIVFLIFWFEGFHARFLSLSLLSFGTLHGDWNTVDYSCDLFALRWKDHPLSPAALLFCVISRKHLLS